jgi:hypothetical protein
MLTRFPPRRQTKVPGNRLITHPSTEIVAALDAWISQQPEPIQRALRPSDTRCAIGSPDRGS